MYQDFYRFSCNPFAAPADARQIFMASAHRDALSSLIVDVLKCRPFVAVAGDGDVGKTTVLNAALASLADRRRRKPVHVTRVNDSRLAHLSARRIIGRMLDKPAGELTDEDLIRLSYRLTTGRDDASQHVLVIDDARSLNLGALQFLRLVSGMQRQGVPFLQVILAGRHDFWDTLAKDEHCPIHNFAAGRSAVEALAEQEVRQYIDYRLMLAGSSIGQVVTDAALGDIVHHGQALPGRINRVLDRAFAVGAAQGRSRVTPQVVDEAVAQLQIENLLPPAPVEAPRPALSTLSLSTFMTSGHAGREAAEDTPPAGQINTRNETGFAWRTAVRDFAAMGSIVRGSAWLAAAAAMVALGIGLTMGVWRLNGASDVTTAAVTPTGAAVVPAPAPDSASAGTDQPVADGNRENRQLPAAATETVSHIVTQASGGNPAGAAPADGLTQATQPLPAMRPVLASEPVSSAPLPISDLPAADPDGSRDIPGLTNRPPAVQPALVSPEPAQTPDSAAAAAAASLPAAAALPSAVTAKLLERGSAMFAAGDIAAARLLYKRAAAAGSAQAAAEVGKTYDARFLANTRAVGVQADPVIATDWYRHAAALGDTEAASLLQQATQ